MHEDGVGMARTFELEFSGAVTISRDDHEGFFAWADGTSGGSRYEAAGDYGAPAEGYRATRSGPGGGGSVRSVSVLVRRNAPIAVLSGAYGAEVVGPLVATLARPDVRVVAVENRYFGGNVAVTGLMVGEDVGRVLAEQPEGHRYLLPDVCLSGGRFLDGTSPAELPRRVEIVATDGVALRRALGER
ncbi:MAG: DUF512 domain-containing protein [Acidimicrobiales bacterium]